MALNKFQHPPSKPCSICGLNDDNPAILGDFHYMKELKVHYYCLLLSTNMCQKGKKDTCGILGFLYRDISNEAKDALLRICKYCKKPGASISCHTCNIYYHNLCGYKNNCSSEFFGEYFSYCNQHILQEPNPPLGDEELECGICFKPMVDYNPVSWITTKCCNTKYVHLECMRKVALTAGYYLSCIFCSDQQFREDVKSQNVFVPDRDALWEKDDTFLCLYKKKKRCGHIKCLCVQGKDFEAKTGLWVIHSCKVCSIKSFHRGCMKKDLPDDFTCNICQKVLNDKEAINYTNNNMYLSSCSMFNDLSQNQEFVHTNSVMESSQAEIDEAMVEVWNVLEKTRKDEKEYKEDEVPDIDRMMKDVAFLKKIADSIM
ncbi:G2E3.2 family protein [Megaselia abdita]